MTRKAAPRQKARGTKSPATNSPTKRFRSRKSERTGKSAPTRPPEIGQGKRGEQGYLGYLLRQAQGAARLTLERSLAELAVTPPQFMVLTMLKAYPGLSGADLARVALLTPQTVGVIIRNLERDGAIRKTPHPVHGRVLQWTLTRRGLSVLKKSRRRALALERRLAADLSDANLTVIRHWLSKIAVTLHQES